MRWNLILHDRGILGRLGLGMGPPLRTWLTCVMFLLTLPAPLFRNASPQTGEVIFGFTTTKNSYMVVNVSDRGPFRTSRTFMGRTNAITEFSRMANVTTLPRQAL